ncbi:hypothetical protein PCASD_15090 [Puccinia coronata f. sp. avenae]|uniref:Uncharacterized protein n=1 Tax=Puccinia coronata f. sp. avenae TaxID=200324 RepID=A0A2N5T696_9BASI|nr:hypothetical protein PCASD_15090 [Puccinia coronata f. sp. avenae]
MDVGEKSSLRQRTRQVLLKGRQDLDSEPRSPASPIRRNVQNEDIPVSSSHMDEITTVQGRFNQLLAIANPLTASNLGGEVVGGVSLVGGFYATPTAISSVTTLSADPTSSRSTSGARPTTVSSSVQSSSRSPTSLGTSSTQVPKTTSSPAVFPLTTPNSATSYGLPSTISSTGYSSPSESSMNLTDGTDRTALPGGVIAGIAVGIVLLVLMILLGCWYLLLRRRATLAKRKTQRESFLNNPILSSLMVPNQYASSFRGTPYPGEEGDMYYGGPPSIARNTFSSFGPAFRQSREQTADVVEQSRLNEVNYFEVTGDPPRMDSLRPMKQNVVGFMSPRHSNHGARVSNTYTNTTTQYLPQDAASEATDDNRSFRTRRSTFRSEVSAGSLIFPEVAKFRSVPKNEAGIPIQNLQANRVKSQMAGNIFEYERPEYDQESDMDNRDSQNVDPDFPSFYLPRAGDPKKISVDRVELPTQSLVSRITNFSYPMPRVVPSPPPVPGPILNRPRYKYGQNARRAKAAEQAPSPVSQPAEETTTQPGSTATPGFANNRYIPTKGRKRKTNANVLSALHKSSLRKSSAKSMLPKRQSMLRLSAVRLSAGRLSNARLSAVRLSTARLSAARLSTARFSTARRTERKNVASVSSIDIPDPYVVVN